MENLLSKLVGFFSLFIVSVRGHELKVTTNKDIVIFCEAKSNGFGHTTRF